MSLPLEQTCAWIDTPGEDAKIDFRSTAIPKPGRGQVLVRLEVSGVCHSDCHSIFGTTPMTTHVAGHEGIGQVVQVGEEVEPDLLGARNVPGTFQEYTLGDAKFVSRIPDTVSSTNAAPLLCGGITTYNALSKAGLSTGDFVVITGAGGGLGHLGVQLAANMGFKVIAVDSGAEKEALCYKLGATHFIDFKKHSSMMVAVHNVTNIGAHAVLCVAGSPGSYDSAVSLLRNCGTLICVGIPPPSYRLSVNPFELLVRGIRVQGTSVGNKDQMQKLMKLAADGKIEPSVELFDFSELPTVLDKLQSAQITGRAVITF